MSPEQNATSGPALETGKGFTVTETVSFDEHPFSEVVTINKVVIGFAVTLVCVTVGFEIVLLLSPVDGVHE